MSTIRPDVPGEDRPRPPSDGARTDLAWSRSGLSLLVAAGAVLKVLVDIDDFSAPAILAAVLVAIGAGWGLTLAYGRYVAKGSLEGQLHADQRKLKVVAGVTTVFGVAAAVIALLPQG